MAMHFFVNDGTGQCMTSGSLSNPAKIFNALPGQKQDGLKADISKVDSQLEYYSYYYRGIGTDHDHKIPQPDTRPLAKRVWDALQIEVELFGEQVTGTAIKNRCEDMLTDLKAKYKDGDEVIFIGFSRGAAGVRITASLAKKLFPNIKVRYLLAFDTVYSVMGPLKILDFPETEFLKNNDIEDHIDFCDHLIAGDEMRDKFPLTPVNSRKNIRQILFSGSHSDVGGGADHCGLSDTPLNVALDKFKELGIKLNQQVIQDLKIAPDVTFTIGFDLFNGTGQHHYPRNLNGLAITVHKSVFERTKAGKSTAIALAQLATFWTDSNADLVELNEVKAKFSIHMDPCTQAISKNPEVSM